MRYQIVPVEPTEEMLAAANAADREYTVRNFGPDHPTVSQGGYDHYAAMLQAAPGGTQDAELVERVARWLFRNDWPNTMLHRYHEGDPDHEEIRQGVEDERWHAHINDAKTLIEILEGK